jgi:DNA-binding PadR family transcriptional regulator
VADYATLLRDHVTLKVRSIDRIFLQAYVPKLQSVGQVCTFLRWQRGFPIPSSAAFGKIGQQYVKDIERFATEHDIPMIRFEKGENKEKRVRPLLQVAAREGGDGRVVLIGVAQEKASAWRSWKAKGQENAAHPHMEWGRQMVYVNHYYFYLWDPEWGPAFWKTNAYAPYPIWLWLNGHEWAKRQMEKAGIAYKALDNGFLSCADPVALQERCDHLGSGAVRDFFWRWYWRLPSPLSTEDFEAGYVYETAFRQFEVSDTVIFDRPQAGRAWFEGVIRDHLDIGRPDQVSLVFQRRISRRTPGSFRTRVITKGVEPILTCYYKSSRLKQYFKEGWGLRTELVVCDTRDFGIGRRVCAKNWNALRAVGDSANRRLCDAEAQDAMPAPDVVTFQCVSRPSTTADGLYAPGLRFGDPRVMAVLGGLVAFCNLIEGFTNKQLVKRVDALLDAPYTTRQATYDLRRLKRKGLIRRRRKKHRYELTALGRRVAVLFTKAYGRVLAPGLALLDPALPEGAGRRSPLAKAWRNLGRAFDDFAERSLIAA